MLNQMKLSQIADIRMGYPFRSRIEHEADGDIAVVQMKDISESNFIDLATAVRVNLPDVQPHHFIQNGDLIFRSRGANYAAALASEIAFPVVLAAPLMLVRPKGALPDYLLWYINLDNTQALLGELSEGTSTKMISKAALAQLEVPILPRHQQEMIIELSRMQQQEEKLMSEIVSQRKKLTKGILMRYARNTR